MNTFCKDVFNLGLVEGLKTAGGTLPGCTLQQRDVPYANCDATAGRRQRTAGTGSGTAMGTGRLGNTPGALTAAHDTVSAEPFPGLSAHQEFSDTAWPPAVPRKHTETQ